MRTGCPASANLRASPRPWSPVPPRNASEVVTASWCQAGPTRAAAGETGLGGGQEFVRRRRTPPLTPGTRGPAAETNQGDTVGAHFRRSRRDSRALTPDNPLEGLLEEMHELRLTLAADLTAAAGAADAGADAVARD